MKKIQIVLGLSILAVVALTMAFPVNANSKSLVGGWVFGEEGTCCWGNVDDNCLKSAFPAVCTVSLELNLCDISEDSDDEGECEFETSQPCTGNLECSTAYDTDCVVPEP